MEVLISLNITCKGLHKIIQHKNKKAMCRLAYKEQGHLQSVLYHLVSWKLKYWKTLEMEDKLDMTQ